MSVVTCTFQLSFVQVFRDIRRTGVVQKTVYRYCMHGDLTNDMANTKYSMQSYEAGYLVVARVLIVIF